MTIRVKAFAGLLVTLLLVTGSAALSLYIQSQDAELIGEAARQGLISGEVLAQIELRRNTAQDIIVAVQAAALGIIGLLMLSVNRTVLQPLTRLTDAASSITYGKMATLGSVNRSDEVGLLTNALSRMVATVNDREDELRTRHREIATMLETVPAAFILVDKAGNVRLQNRVASELVGPPPKFGSAMQKYRAEFTLVTRDGKEIPEHDWPLARALRGDVVTGEDVEIRSRFAATTALIAAAPLRSATGDIDGAVLALQDVSALRALDRMKDEFVSVVSHELRTPLTSIRGSLQLVLEDEEQIDRDHEQLLTVALNNCERLIRIINDILDVSKIEAGRLTLKRQPTQVRQLLETSKQVVETVASNAHVELDLRIPDELPLVDVDSDRIVQVLVNLISNAVNYAPADSAVTIEAAVDGEDVSIAVQDRGVGISESDLARLFQKYQQIDTSGSRRKGGTGLGLAISKALVEQHGGRIAVQSQAGRGSCFTIYVPSVPTSRAPAVTRPARAQVPSANGTVLVIDDDDDFRLVIRRHLERAGYRVLEAREGAEGLRMARDERPDVMTLDLMMPGMSGWELLVRLSDEPELRSIPVMIITAIADQNRSDFRVMHLTATAYLAKPIDAGELAKRIEGLVARPA